MKKTLAGFGLILMTLPVMLLGFVYSLLVAILVAILGVACKLAIVFDSPELGEQLIKLMEFLSGGKK